MCVIFRPVKNYLKCNICRIFLAKKQAQIPYFQMQKTSCNYILWFRRYVHFFEKLQHQTDNMFKKLRKTGLTKKQGCWHSYFSKYRPSRVARSYGGPYIWGFSRNGNMATSRRHLYVRGRRMSLRACSRDLTVSPKKKKD